MNAHILTSLLQVLENNPDLLTPVHVSPHAQIAMQCIKEMLNSLPSNSPLLPFISENYQNLRVMATLTENKLTLLQEAKCFSPGFTLEGTTRSAGVYV